MMKKMIQFALLVHLLLVLIALPCLHASSNASCTSWHYGEHNGDDWPSYCVTCGGTKQSPVDLTPSSSVYDATLATLQFRNYDVFVADTKFDIKNNGHTVEVDASEHNESHPIGLYGGGLGANYTLQQFHFHWGGDSHVGSEHTVDGVRYPEEMHIVHYNSDKYRSFSEAVNQSDGIAVLGIFIQISNVNNTEFEKILINFRNISKTDMTVKNIALFAMSHLLPDSPTEFYRYSGSLTTPPCFQSVTWTVFRHPYLISAIQMDEFRTLIFTREGDEYTPLINNYRSLQPLNGRSVYRSFNDTEVQWSYDATSNIGPESWKNMNPMCGWSMQSPVNIQSHTDDLNLSNLTYNFTSLTPGQLTFNITNTGHAVELTVGAGATLRGGNLDGVYVLDKIVFHWSNSTTSGGSEHVVYSRLTPLEIQFVYHSDKYSNWIEASKHDSGLAIVAVLASPVSGTSTNNSLNTISSALTNVTTKGKSVLIRSFDLNELLPTDRDVYYRYNGSLTSPNCAEAVVWTVYDEAIQITEQQLSAFRGVQIDGRASASKNSRPVQPLNGRRILRATGRRIPVSSAPPVAAAAITSFTLFPALLARLLAAH